MNRLILSAAAVGLALGLSGPAAASNLSGDCQTQLREVRTSLQDQRLSETQRSDINEKLREAQQADNNRECLQIVSSLERDYLSQNQETAAVQNDDTVVLRQGTSSERIVVEQPDPQVRVQQPPPRVQVQQVAPEVTVSQGQPEVIVEQAQPKVTVRQPAPEVTVQQAEPKVTVRMPEPEVGVEQKDVKVSVVQPEPNVSVEQADPDVRVVQPEPDVVLQEGEPEVQVQKAAKAQIDISKSGSPDVSVQQAQPDVSVREAQPEIDVQRVGKADVRYESAEPEVNIEYEGREGQQAANTQAAQSQGDNTQMQDRQAQDQSQKQTQAQVQDQTADSPTVIVVSDIIGRDLTSIEGQDLGEVTDVVSDSAGEHYLVISRGGFFGMGGEESLIPMSRVSYGSESLTAFSEGDLQQDYDRNQFTSLEEGAQIDTGTL